jgi:threonine efflux protein
MMEGLLPVLSIAGAITLGAMTLAMGVGGVFCIEAGWYAIVALALSAPAPAAAYLRWKARIDRAAGGVMGLLGIKLIYDAGH